MSVDLHIHSTASDGTLEPFEIIEAAQSLNLKAIAITDHDTVDGSRDAISAGIPSNIKFLTGVEISSSAPEPFVCSGNFHILGYGFDLDEPHLNDALNRCQQAREERNPKIISKLNDAGMALTFEEVLEEAGGGLVGRPHMANLLVKKGYCTSIDEAFSQYLAKGKAAYVEKYRIGCEEAIGIIKSAGGIPVLAHPVSLKMDDDEIESLALAMKGMGLEGIEVYYSNHSKKLTEYLCKLCEKLNLLATGGSDYHGTLKDNISLGSGRGDLSIPYELYELIAAALDKNCSDRK